MKLYSLSNLEEIHSFIKRTSYARGVFIQGEKKRDTKKRYRKCNWLEERYSKVKRTRATKMLTNLPSWTSCTCTSITRGWFLRTRGLGLFLITYHLSIRHSPDIKTLVGNLTIGLLLALLGWSSGNSWMRGRSTRSSANSLPKMEPLLSDSNSSKSEKSDMLTMGPQDWTQTVTRDHTRHTTEDQDQTVENKDTKIQ